jgi:hypothetical protein
MIRRRLRVRKPVVEHFKELRYNNSMLRLEKYNSKDPERPSGWIVEHHGYGYPCLRNFYSKLDDAVDYMSSSLKYEFKNKTVEDTEKGRILIDW